MKRGLVSKAPTKCAKKSAAVPEAYEWVRILVDAGLNCSGRDALSYYGSAIIKLSEIVANVEVMIKRVDGRVTNVKLPKDWGRTK